MSDKIKYRITIGAAIVGLLANGFFGILPLVAPLALLPGKSVESALGVYALYMAIRNLTLASFIMAAVVFRDRKVLGWILLLNGVIQTADILVGIIQQNVGQTLGPAFFAVLFLWSGVYLLQKYNVSPHQRSPQG